MLTRPGLRTARRGGASLGSEVRESAGRSGSPAPGLRAPRADLGWDPRGCPPRARRPPSRAAPRLGQPRAAVPGGPRGAGATAAGHPCRPRHPGAAAASAGPGGYLGLSRRISAADAAILEAPSPAARRQLLAAQPMAARGREPGRTRPHRRPACGLPPPGPAVRGSGGATVLPASPTCSELGLYPNKFIYICTFTNCIHLHMEVCMFYGSCM